MTEEIAASEKLLTFIIPVYKVEKYINECVDSILNQLTDACEVILVDDGSPDRSGVICDGYADRDSRVKVVHQKNGGLAAARNTGLDCARGEYIAFVDSDDYLDGQCVSKILNWITLGGADICFMRAMKVFPDGKQQLLDDEMNAAELKGSKGSAIKYLSERSKYPGSPCTKLFRRALLERNHLRFPDDRRVSEDLGFVLQCILNADSYDALPIDYYYYRQAREGSITNNVTYKSFLGLRAFVEESINNLTENKSPKGNIERYAMSFVAYEFSIMIWQYSRIGEEFKSGAAKTLNEYSWVLSYGRTKKTHLVRWTMQILGVETTMRMLDIYMRLRSSNRGGVKRSSFTITLQPFANSYLPACGGCC